MKHNFYKIQEEMNEEINNNVKKVWIVPELEVLDGRKTYNGEGAFFAENDRECVDSDDCNRS